ncbi:MAG TPA: hypothetical protein VJV97_05855 [Gemmatimonadaceae bacterium]|nr:hypothetical protein [Gemmatimonadaceae bacterium]
MFRTRLIRFLTVLTGAVLITSCSDSVQGPTSLSASVATSDHRFRGGGTSSGGSSTTSGLSLEALWWDHEYDNIIVSKTIGPSGGVISIPETGLTMEFPVGALSSPLTITITADQRYVAYKMEPTGTQFLKDVTVTQSLLNTTLAGEPLTKQLYAAYVANDSLQLSGKVPVTELEQSKTIFSATFPDQPQAEVWLIRHFSRYMLASD